MELKTIGLTKKFGSKTAVNDLNITLSNGVYGLLGANGAGKTTFMRLLCNIQNPTSGKVLLNCKNRRDVATCTEISCHRAGDNLPPCRDTCHQ